MSSTRVGGSPTPRSRNSERVYPPPRYWAGYPNTSWGLTSDTTRQKGSGRSGRSSQRSACLRVDLVPPLAERARVAGAEVLSLGVLARVRRLPVGESVLPPQPLRVRWLPATQQRAGARGVSEVPLALVGDLITGTPEPLGEVGGLGPKLGLVPGPRAELKQAPAELPKRAPAWSPRPSQDVQPASSPRPAGCADPAAGRPGCASTSRRAVRGRSRSAASRGSASTSTCCRSPSRTRGRYPRGGDHLASSREANPGRSASDTGIAADR